jgi:Zn-dependent protease with chaperone function
VTSLAALGVGLALAWLALPFAVRLASLAAPPVAACRRLRLTLFGVAALPVLVAGRPLLPEEARPRLPVTLQVSAWLTGSAAQEPRPREPLRLATAFEALGSAWLLMLLLGLVSEAGRGWQRRRLFERSLPVPPEIESLVRDLAARTGMPGVRVRIAPELGYAGAFGVVTPSILLSEADLELDRDELGLVVSHELTHLLRGDPLFGILENLALGGLALHPALPALRRALATAREAAVDGLVARGRPLEYAQLLLRIAARGAVAHPLTVSSGTGLHRRIEMLSLPSSPTRFAILPSLGVPALVGALGLFAPAAFAEPFEGGLPPPEQVEPRIATDSDECYALATKSDAKLVVDTLAHLELNSDGQVQVARIPSSSSVFQSCIEGRALAWRFPVPPPGGHKPPPDAKLFVAFPIRRSPD